MDERVQKYEQKMTKTLDGFEAELTTIRAGRANPHILDKITVDYYGSPTPLQQVANITVPEERRKDLVKDVKKKGEAAKVAVRNIRRDANDAFKKLTKQDVSEDEVKDLEDAVQKLTDKFIKKIDAAVEVKSKEILTV